MLFFLAFLVSLTISLGPTKRTLVIYDEPNNFPQTHSLFLSHLSAIGHEITLKSIKDRAVSLENYGRYEYENVILVVPETTSRNLILDAVILLDFVNNGNGNLMVVASTELTEVLREVSTECGVTYDDADSLVTDHKNFDRKRDDGSNSYVLTKKWFGRPVFDVPEDRPPVLFRGLGMNLEEGNHLLVPLLTGERTSYSFDSEEEEPHALGLGTVYVAGLQTRKGSRVTFVGSVDMLSNSYIDAQVENYDGEVSGTGNEAFISDLVSWSFQERGMLRHRNVRIHHPEEEDGRSAYKITTYLSYSVIIEEWNGKEWAPFLSEDVPVEFVMLDPYIRVYLKHDGTGRYYTKIQIPDKYGIFKFKVDYRRKGYSLLHFEDQVTVRPVRTNEFERFIGAAYPYYITVGLMMIAFFLFSVVFLYLEDKKVKTN